MGNKGQKGPGVKPPEGDEEGSRSWSKVKKVVAEKDLIMSGDDYSGYSRILQGPQADRPPEQFWQDWETHGYGLAPADDRRQRTRKNLTLGRTRPLGKGSFGFVFDVTANPGFVSTPDGAGVVTDAHRYVAKSIDKYDVYDKATEDNVAFVLNLRREVEIMWKLPDSLFGKIVTWYEDQQFVFIIMAKYSLSLAQHLEAYLGRRPRQEIPIPYVRSWMHCVFRGLHFLASKGFGHFDIKPDNVCTKPAAGGEPSQEAVIIDFGYARKVPVKKGVGFTAAYAAPEVMSQQRPKGGKTADTPADVWSAGVSLWELLLMAHPWGDQCDVGDHKARLKQGTLFEQTGYRPPDITRVPSVDAQEVIVACLQPKPDKRPTAEAVLGMDYFSGLAGRLGGDAPSAMASAAGYRAESRAVYGSEEEDEDEDDVSTDEGHPLFGYPVYEDHLRLLRENRRLKRQLRNVAAFVRRAEALLAC